MTEQERKEEIRLDIEAEPFRDSHAFPSKILDPPHKHNIDKILTTPYDWLCVKISNNEYKIIVRIEPDNEFKDEFILEVFTIRPFDNNGWKGWKLLNTDNKLIKASPSELQINIKIDTFISLLRSTSNFLVIFKSATKYVDQFSHEDLVEEVGRKKKGFNKHFAKDEDMFSEGEGIKTLEEKLKKEGDWLVMKKDENEHILLLKCRTKTRKFRFKKIDNKKITVHGQEKYRFSIIKVRIGVNKSEESYFYYKDIFDCINDIRLGVPPRSVFYDKLVNECPLKDLITPEGSTRPGPSPSPTTGPPEAMDF
jgi:hypothetical protein